MTKLNKTTFFIPLLLTLLLFVGCAQLETEKPAVSKSEELCVLSFDPDTSESTVVKAIENAEYTIDIALYGFENEAVADALLDAAWRGVEIRCVTEYDSEGEEGWQRLIEADRDYDELDISIQLGNSNGIMHNKYFIIDSEYVVTGSTNLTEGMFHHFNNLILLKSPSLAEDFQRDFDVLFAGYFASKKGNSAELTTEDNGYNFVFGSGQTWPEEEHSIGQYTVQAFFTPYKAVFPSYKKDSPVDYEYYNYENEGIQTDTYDNAMNIIFPLIENAEKSIYIYSFAFTDKVVMDLLAKAQARGVSVKVWMDYVMFQSGFSHSGKSIIALSKQIDSLRICRKPDGGLLHHKVILIDGEIVVLGSLNFSSNAVSSNDENFLVIRNAETIHAAFMTEAEKIDEVSREIRIDEEDMPEEGEPTDEGE